MRSRGPTRGSDWPPLRIKAEDTTWWRSFRCFLVVLVGWLTAGAAYGQQAAPAPVGAPTGPELVQKEARRLLTTMNKTRYTAALRFDEENRSYDCNCSGLVDYVVRRVVGLGAKQPVAVRLRPKAIDFHTVLAAASEKPPTKGLWQRVPSLLDAVPGDVIAWRRVKYVSGPTGHVVILDAPPVKEADGLVRVSVIDSTSRPHVEDTRQKGQTGIGRGTMWFKVNEQGVPSAYVRQKRDNPAIEEPIAIGRLISPGEKAPTASGTPKLPE